MSTEITRDEWMRALNDAGYRDDIDDQDAVTMEEFAAMMKLPRTTADCRMRALVLAGKATKTRKWAVNSYGRRMQYVAYTLAKAGKRKGKAA